MRAEWCRNFAIRNDVFDETPAMVSTKLNDLLESENDYTILLSHRPELFETYINCAEWYNAVSNASADNHIGVGIRI